MMAEAVRSSVYSDVADSKHYGTCDSILFYKKRLFGCIKDVAIKMEKSAGAGFRLAAASNRPKLSGL